MTLTFLVFQKSQVMTLTWIDLVTCRASLPGEASDVRKEISETRESVEKEPVWLLLAGETEEIERGGVEKASWAFDVTAVGRCGWIIKVLLWTLGGGKLMYRKKKKFDYLMLMC